MHFSTKTFFPIFVIFLFAFCVKAEANLLKNVKTQTPFAKTSSAKFVYSDLVEKEHAPKLDGVLDEELWKKAKPYTGFIDYSSGKKLEKGQTSLKFLHTKDALYIAAHCDAASDKGVKHDAPHESRDTKAYQDDCLDIFLAPGPSSIYQLMLGASGAILDSKNSNPAWDPEWKSAVIVNEKGWDAEIMIPLKAIQCRAKKGKGILFNVGRASAPKPRVTSSLFSGYSDYARMGYLIFGTPEERSHYLTAYPEASIKDIRFFMNKCIYDDLDEAAYGRVSLLGFSNQGRNKDGLSLNIQIVDNNTKKTVNSDTAPLTGEVVDFELDPLSLPSGDYIVKLNVKNAEGKVLKEKEYPLTRVKSVPASKEGTVQLQADIPSEAAKYISKETPFPAYAGVPMPRGCVDNNTEYRLFDKNGKAVPCQTKILSTWSPKGSARWLGVYFQMTSPKDKTYSLKFASKLSEAPKLLRNVSVKKEKNSIFVDTGSARFEILKSGFDGIHQAWFIKDGKMEPPLLESSKKLSPYVADQNGKVYKSSLDKNSKVSVELSGPLCAVLKASGWFVAEDGTKVGKHVTRIFAYAGLSWVKIINTFIFCADSRKVKISDIGFPFALSGGHAEYRLSVSPKDMYFAKNSISLLQHEKDAYKIGEPSSSFVYSVGKKAEGWMETRNAAKSAIAVGLRDFCQNYPKELEGSKGIMSLHIWPKNGENKTRKILTDDNLAELWFMHHRKLLDFQTPEWFSSYEGRDKKKSYRYVKQSAKANGMGVAKTSEMFLNLRTLKKDTTPAVAAFINQPPLVCASPKWMCDSGVFGALSSADNKSFPVIEGGLEARFDGERYIEKYSSGMWNYGGSNTYFRPRKKSFWQLERPWRLTHHGGPRVPWLLFARTGKRKFFEYGRKNTVRCADVGFCHYSTPEMEKLGYSGKIKGAQCDYKGIVPWNSGARVMDYNSMTDFMHYYYYLTGDKWPFEVSLEWGECARQRFKPGGARSASGRLDAILTLYEDTWDMDYREMAERQFDHLADNLMTKDGRFYYGNWYDYAPWLSHYHRMTGSKKAGQKAVDWSSRLIRDNHFYNMPYGTDTCYIYGMGYPLYDVFRVAYEHSNNPVFLENGLGNALVTGMSILNNPASSQHGFDMYSHHSAGGYYQQTVPYILPLLKKKKGEFRAVYPRWGLSGPQINMHIKDFGKKDLELRFGARYKEQAPDKVLVCPAKGKPFERKLKVNEDLIFKASGNGKNTAIYTYCKLDLKADMLDGKTKLVFSRSDGKPVRLSLPIQFSHPVKTAFEWSDELHFSRGSALYFLTPADGSPVAVKASGRLSMPHSLAFLNDKDEIVEIEQWFSPEVSRAEVKLEDVPCLEQRGKIWTCLQGLSKSLSIKRAASSMLPYFSDRPERYFTPATAKRH